MQRLTGFGPTSLVKYAALLTPVGAPHGGGTWTAGSASWVTKYHVHDVADLWLVEQWRMQGIPRKRALVDWLPRYRALRAQVVGGNYRRLAVLRRWRASSTNSGTEQHGMELFAGAPGTEDTGVVGWWDSSAHCAYAYVDMRDFVTAMRGLYPAMPDKEFDLS